MDMPEFSVQGLYSIIYAFDATVIAGSKKEAKRKVKNFEWDDVDACNRPEYRISVSYVEERQEEEDEDEEEEGGSKAPDPKPEKTGREPGR
jgi:hypothetical protein